MLLHSENIILIPIQSVFALSSECWVLSGEATNINIKVFGWTWPGLEPTIYRTRFYMHVKNFVAITCIEQATFWENDVCYVLDYQKLILIVLANWKHNQQVNLSPH